MKYTVVYSPEALKDLDRVWDEVFTASADITVTGRYLDDLLDKVDEKSAFPFSGKPLYYQDSFTGYYMIIFKAYLVFYRLDGHTLFVDRVLYGKSDYLRFLNLPTEDIK
ncbi:MAG: type II toxin-antitoxin system RelE/ParE family toxin [Eubacterium sp.]|nr:type II toxin-antitoxin system RelE/ParE family toxin [Eubacterium sp.]